MDLDEEKEREQAHARALAMDREALDNNVHGGSWVIEGRDYDPRLQNMRVLSEHLKQVNRSCIKVLRSVHSPCVDSAYGPPCTGPRSRERGSASPAIAAGS